jgi:hypothetical protein
MCMWTSFSVVLVWGALVAAGPARTFKNAAMHVQQRQRMQRIADDVYTRISAKRRQEPGQPPLGSIDKELLDEITSLEKMSLEGATAGPTCGAVSGYWVTNEIAYIHTTTIRPHAVPLTLTFLLYGHRKRCTPACCHPAPPHFRP